jgi:hypothetical protein
MMSQPDLFADHASPRPAVDPQIVEMTRQRLHATLALVQGAAAMPWDDMLRVIREDNSFRWGKDLLPPEEGQALWAAFDREMDRLYAIMNAGKEIEPPV